VWLTALLFGLYAFFSASFRLGNGIAVLPGNIIVGLIAAALTMRSGSPFVGALVLSGFNLGGAVYPSGFIQGLAQTGDILSIQWLTSVLVAGFVAFLLVQFSSVFGVAQDKLRGRPAARLWWSPLLLVALLTAALLFGEITTRRQNVRAVPTPSTGGSTIPPISP
jgi:MFS superfamily sulfate permease-like transporter